MNLVYIQQILHRPWQSIWRNLPTGVRYFLQPYYRRIFSNRFIVVLWPTFRCN